MTVLRNQHSLPVLTTGGGWQDQVGAIYGGFKIGRSSGRLPLKVRVKPIESSIALKRVLDERLFLVYTGQQRLAKNTLIRALRHNALTPCTHQQKNNSSSTGSVVTGEELIANTSTVSALVHGAEIGYSLLQKFFGSASFTLIDDDDDDEDGDHGDDEVEYSIEQRHGSGNDNPSKELSFPMSTNEDTVVDSLGDVINS